MTDRRRRIILLIGSRHDYGCSVKGARFAATRGPVADQWRTCPTCSGDGWLTDRYKRRTVCGGCSSECAGCEGGGCKSCRQAGRVWPRGHRGEVHVDSHTGQQVGSSESGQATRSTATRRCDRCDGSGVWKHKRCELCDGQGERPLPLALRLDTNDDGGGIADHVDAIIDGLQRKIRAGSYLELEKALWAITHTVNKPERFRILTLHASEARRLLDELYLPPVSRRESELSFWESSLVELALAYIDLRMPDPIRVPGAVAANERERDRQLRRVRGKPAGAKARELRDAEIRKLAKDGKPAQWLAQEFGLHVSVIYDVCNGRSREGAA